MLHGHMHIIYNEMSKKSNLQTMQIVLKGIAKVKMILLNLCRIRK